MNSSNRWCRMSRIIGNFSEPVSLEDQGETHNEKFRRISNRFNLRTNPDLKVMAQKSIVDYDTIKGVLNMAKESDPRSTFLIITKNNNSDEILEGIEDHLTKYIDIKGMEFRTIPWIPLELPADYECPHGEDYKDVYLFFFSATEKMFEELVSAFKNYEKAKVAV